MHHLALLVICILSVEFFFIVNFLSLLNSTLSFSKKIVSLIPNTQISDHWKEKIVPVYSLIIMKLCVQILLAISCILFFFIMTEFLLSGFVSFTFSLLGIIETMIFIVSYTYIKTSKTK